MPIGCAIDERLRLVATRAWGTITNRELLGHRSALSRDARFAPDFRQLADFGGVTTIDVTAAGIRQTGISSPFGLGARRALVVSQDLAFGLARM